VRSRSDTVDALRGLAVFGILLVNIWSFRSGFESLHYGVLPAAATLADRAAVFLTAFLGEQKFYPIFSFLFGAGFALHGQALRRRPGGWPLARQLLRRRLRWLLFCGLLHGSLVWFGDILSLYGVAGFAVVALAGARLRHVRRALFCALALWLLLIGYNFLNALALTADGALAAVAPDLVSRVEAARQAYTLGSAGEIALRRLVDYSTLLQQSVYMLPHVVSLFLLGTLAARLGWLTRQWRHRAMWRQVRWIGLLVGVPLNFLWAVATLAEAVDPAAAPAYTYVLYAFMPVAGSCLAAALVACFMLAARGRAPAREEGTLRHARENLPVRLLAPAGRLALTNYLSQSVLCSLLLQGTGLGLGARLSHGGMLALVGAIAVAQLLFSHWWLRRWRQGPVEMLYRRQTRLK
jgi:uncharacterized protein